jgi:hypothetical protein
MIIKTSVWCLMLFTFISFIWWHWWNRNCLPCRSTWVHLFMLLNLTFLCIEHIFPSICIVTSVNRNLGFVQGVDRYFHDYLNLTESISTAICWWWTGFVFEVKDTTDTTGFAWYTDLHIDIDSDSRLRTTPYTEVSMCILLTLENSQC